MIRQIQKKSEWERAVLQRESVRDGWLTMLTAGSQRGKTVLTANGYGGERAPARAAVTCTWKRIMALNIFINYKQGLELKTESNSVEVERCFFS